VIEGLLKSGRYRIRGLTRRPESERARQLQQRGVEIVRCNIMNREEVSQAMKGAFGVYAVTNFWDPVDGGFDREVQQGKNLFDAAQSQGVRHFIYSSLENAQKISGGKYKVDHFTSKAVVEEYIRSKMGQNKSTLISFIYCGFYMENLLNFLRPNLQNDTFLFRLNLRETANLPMFTPEDLGPIVPGIFEGGDKFHTKAIPIGSEMSMSDMVRTFEKVLTRPTRLETISSQEYSKITRNPELAEMNEYIDQVGYFREHRDFTIARQLNPSMVPLDAWLKRHQTEFTQPSTRPSAAFPVRQ